MPRWLVYVIQAVMVAAGLFCIWYFTYISALTGWRAGFWIGLIGGSLMVGLGFGINRVLKPK